MKHLTVGMLALLLTGQMLHAECFTPENGKRPTKVTFSDGTWSEVIKSDGEELTVVTHRPGKPAATATLLSGLFYLSLAIEGGGTYTYTWTEPLPTLADLVPGATFERSATIGGAGQGTIQIGIQVTGKSTYTFGDCVYPVLVIEFRSGPADAPTSVTKRLMDPWTMLGLSTDTTIIAPDGTHTVQHWTIATMQ